MIALDLQFNERHYYTLMTSLPHLPYFERAERLPINRSRLVARLQMLEPGDLEIVEKASDFLEWRRRPDESSDEQLIARYRRLVEEVECEPLRRLVDFRMAQRSVIAALRRRKLEMGLPRDGRPWGVGPLIARIEANFDEPCFGLEEGYPWIDQARLHFARDEAFELQRLLMQRVWHYADGLHRESPFGFRAVLAYLFQWNILRRWVSYSSKSALKRFKSLTQRIVDGHGTFEQPAP